MKVDCFLTTLACFFFNFSPTPKSAGKGVDDFEIDLPNQKVIVTTSSLSSDQLLETLKKTGKKTEFVKEVDKL